MRSIAPGRTVRFKHASGGWPEARLLVAVAWIGAAIAAGSAHGNPATAVPKPVAIGLANAIELALQNNPEVKAAQSDFDMAAAQQDKAAAGHWPTLRAQAGLTEYRRNQRLYPASSPGEPAVVSHHLAGGDVLLSVPLYTGGRVSGNVDAAELAEDSARHTGQWTKTDLVFQVTRAYYSILAQRQFIAALATSEAAIMEHIDRLVALVEERKAAPLDRQRMQVRLAALKQHRVQEEAALRVQTLSLLSLLGVSKNGFSIELVGELGRPMMKLQNFSETLVQEALWRRADCRALRASVRAQERRTDVSRAGHYPQLLVQGSYGFRWGLWPSEQPDGASALADVGQVGLYVDVPLFEGGRVNAEIREQQARLSSLREKLRQVELRVRLEVEAAVLDFQSAMERVALSETTIAQATEAFRVETEKYTVGKSTVSDVLSAQSDLLDTEASRARALADANIAAAALARAQGAEP